MSNIGTSRSPWSHSICDICWKKRVEQRSTHGLTLSIAELNKNPHRLPEIERQIELCCYCRTLHNSGIYQRDDPRTIQCLGLHDSSITNAVNSVTEDRAYSILRHMLELPEKRSCLTQDEVDAIHYLLTIGELHRGKKKTLTTPCQVG